MSTKLTNYLQFCSSLKRLDPKTTKAYRIDIAQFESYLDQRTVNQVTREDIREYISFLNDHYKPRTVKRKIASIKGYISFLTEEGNLSQNPFTGMRISFPKSLSLPRTIPLKTIGRMLEVVHEEEQKVDSRRGSFRALRDAAVVELLFATGVRISELCSIREEDIDLSEGLVFIHGKGNRERIIEIENAEVLDTLIKYNQVKQASSGVFFLNNRGNPLSDQSARRIIENCAKSVVPGKHITPHMFRHSFATLLLEEDVDIRYIQQLLGHSSISTTQIYAHVSSEKRRAILSAKHPRNKIAII